ncbi:DUF2171 domain-containing protein [Sphingomonas sp. BN140010]|uniref:DUF2171 domain-containing protein n=1 Tax=Sphingomonas arvum TaxID=2992113 RepID=A0ABT3JHI2_9SPHN|nr:DUF2171 domain-containing protein [Sphingomonas sp. BN140010]MCW3798451.1 DUF2171 domain-containing protein [Sphingomonas sp. BN140010]
MANDRYDRGGGYRDEGRYQDRNNGPRGGGGGDNRGFWDRARDEVQSWFGDEDSGGRRGDDDRMSHPDSSRGRSEYGNQGRDPRREHGGAHDDDRSAFFGGGQSTSYGRGREGGDYRSQYGRGGGESGGFGGGDYTSQDRSHWGSTGYRQDQHRDRDQDRGGNRGYPPGYGQRGGGSYSPSPQSRGWEDQHRDRDQDRQRFGQGSFSHDDDRSGFGSQRYGRQSQGGDQYRPMTGDYGRGSSGGQDHEEHYRSGMGGQDFTRSQYGRQDFSQDQGNDRMSGGQRYGGGRDDDRSRNRGGFVGAAAGAGASLLGGRGSSPHDEHYSSWRQRQIDELDNDYHAYRQEHQSRFENEFSGFRQQRQTKRQMLQSIREHFEVVDSSGQHIGMVDKVHGDTVIMTKNDPEAGGVHRSFSCSLLERVEDGKVYLSGTKDSLRGQLHEERGGDDRGSGGGGLLSGLFGGRRDDENRGNQDLNTGATGATGSSTAGQQSGDGPHILDRSFSGTYEDDNKRS